MASPRPEACPSSYRALAPCRCPLAFHPRRHRHRRRAHRPGYRHDPDDWYASFVPQERPHQEEAVTSPWPWREGRA